VAAKRLNATSLPEFGEAVQKYHEVKKLPAGWDVGKMVLHREGDKMLAKNDIEDASVKAKFQQLLDLTHRKVYTRDRMGEAVPERLELVGVTVVTNDDLWGDYMARREAIRQELVADGDDFVRYTYETTTTPAETTVEGERAESIAAALAADFAEPLLPEVNEVYMFHGTSAQAAASIAARDFRINLAGANAGTLYGRGIYFAENASKSDEYTRPTGDNLRYMLLCRTVLGRAYYSDTKETDPRACEDACCRGRFHSVLGDRRKCRGTFREFIVFDEEQIYPNYILVYRRKAAVVDPTRTFQVLCPADSPPGSTLQVVTPDGTKLNVVVPPGVSPGQTFPVQY